MEYTLTLSRATAALRQHSLLLSAPHCPQELTFPALTYDSRAVAPGALFRLQGPGFQARVPAKGAGSRRRLLCGGAAL